MILLAFIPMGCIAAAYNYMNRADPDCGTTFSWVTLAMGPRIGWMSGWAVLVADVLVMPSLSQIAVRRTHFIQASSRTSGYGRTSAPYRAQARRASRSASGAAGNSMALRSARSATSGMGTRWLRRKLPTSPSTPPFSCAP